MSKVSGYFLELDENRYESFRDRSYPSFAEPVPEFKHSRNIPLVCFIINHENIITHIGLGKRGVLSGTDLRRLNIHDIFKLNKQILIFEIIDNINSKFKSYLTNKAKSGGLIPQKSFEIFLEALLLIAPEAIPILDKYTSGRRTRLEKLSIKAKHSLAQQKEAVLTAMNIAGIDRENASGWDYNELDSPRSFLDGINNVRLREDSMIINDLVNLPGFALMKTTKFSSSVFENDKTRLTVLLTNRQPLEELIGTDLIYYNEDFKSFVMVQYKVMEKEDGGYVFRLPNHQFTEEIQRMELIFNSIKVNANTGQCFDFRINENPYFIKICPRLEFDPDNIGLSKGMYVPLDYIKLLQEDKSIEGESGGKRLTFDNIKRYFDNTGFKTIIEGGWIGTNCNQSLIIESLIKDILQNGKTAVIAIKKKLESDSNSKNISDLIEDDFPF